MPFDPSPADDCRIATLAQLAPDGAWQTALAHARRSHLLIWLTKGSAKLMLAGKCHDAGPYSLLNIPAGTLWSAAFSADAEARILAAAAEPAALPPAPLCLRVADPEHQAGIGTLFDAMQGEQQGGAALWQRALHAYCDLAGILLQRLLPAGPLEQRPPAAERLCRAYCARIAEYRSAHSNMAGHAAALKVTPTHLTRVCKQETGKTAAALLTEHQLHAARSLLIGSDLPIRDIAGQLGFGSAAYFTRFISQHTGRTPSELRRSARTTA
ncbi:helix-turn-helix domain-containing protein [Cribrihabitans neustonicus]|uniref:AraC family transcriptional regulator n=1 Tax=Cribrihabitans neustonicus TaxID=1429085 RepID=UPI003B58C3E8